MLALQEVSIVPQERFASSVSQQIPQADVPLKAKKAVNYAVDVESGEEDDDDEGFNPTPGNKPRGRASKRRKTSVESDDDDIFIGDAVVEDEIVDEGEVHHYYVDGLSIV